MYRTEVARPAAVSGLFYPDDPAELRSSIRTYLTQATPVSVPNLRALICPHAGYIYSGPIAGSGYRVLAEQVHSGQRFTRVVVLSPAHHIAFSGVAIPDCTSFVTPLGEVRLWPGCQELAKHRPFVLDSRPHAEEHAVEVHLPFLQYVLESFELVPLVFGFEMCESPTDRLCELVEPHTLFVVSSDLSHYLPYAQARKVDQVTLEHFEQMDPVAVANSDACGRTPAAALLHVARKLGWQIRLLDARNSGDTAGDRSRVVGYAALALSSPDN